MMNMVMSMVALTALLQMRIRLSCGQVVPQIINEVIKDLMRIMKMIVVLGRWFGPQLQLNLIIISAPVGTKTPILKMKRLWCGHQQTITLHSSRRGAKVSDKCATTTMMKMRKIKESLGHPYSKTSSTISSSSRVDMLMITTWVVGEEPLLYLSPPNDKTTTTEWWLTNTKRCPPQVRQPQPVLALLGFPQVTMLICKTLYLLLWYRNKM